MNGTSPRIEVAAAPPAGAEGSLPPAWLSLMYAPADDAGRVQDAAASGADAVILDLEDFVAAEAKAAARRGLRTAVARVREAGADAVVRINRRMDVAVADLDHAVGPDVAAIMVPKTLGADHLRLLDEVLQALEAQRGLARGRIRLIALVETAAALARLGEICAATPRLAAVGLGGEDIARECGMAAGAQTLQHPKQQMIFHAVAAGIVPLGYLSSVADYRGEAAFAEMAGASRRFGFQAATCLHAGQVAVVNRVYAPTPDEVRRAHALLARHADLAPALQPLPPDELAADLRRARLALARAGQAERRGRPLPSADISSPRPAP